MPRAKAPSYRLTGITFNDDYPANLQQLGTHFDGARFKVTLIPHPENEFDPNAVSVVHPRWGHLGWIPGANSVYVATRISMHRRGDVWGMLKVYGYEGDQPGAEVTIVERTT